MGVQDAIAAIPQFSPALRALSPNFVFSLRWYEELLQSRHSRVGSRSFRFGLLFAVVLRRLPPRGVFSGGRNFGSRGPDEDSEHDGTVNWVLSPEEDRDSVSDLGNSFAFLASLAALMRESYSGVVIETDDMI